MNQRELPESDRDSDRFPALNPDEALTQSPAEIPAGAKSGSSSAVGTQNNLPTQQRKPAVSDPSETLRLYSAEASALLIHDLRNGLAVAAADLELILREAGLSGDLLESALSAKQAVRKMTALVSNFVDAARLEAQAIDPKYAVCQISEVLARIADTHQDVDQCELRIECDTELRAEIDAALLERALHNLASNAFRYVELGGRIEIRAFHHGEGSDATLRIIVANTGNPIPEDRVEHLFSRTPNGERRTPTGLGLYFCRLAAEAHGGGIEYRPAPLPQFEMWLPIAASTRSQ